MSANSPPPAQSPASNERLGVLLNHHIKLQCERKKFGFSLTLPKEIAENVSEVLKSYVLANDPTRNTND
jgi:hypothetical protein